MDNKVEHKHLEEAILILIERTTEEVFERFIEGKMTQQEYELLNAKIRCWSLESQHFLQLANSGEVHIIHII